MNKPGLVAGIIIALAIASTTTINILDTFIIDKKEGKAVTTVDYDFDLAASSMENTSFLSSSIAESEDQPLDEESSSLENPSQETLSQTTATFQTLTKRIDGQDVTYYLADIQLARISDFRSRLATNSNGYYGENITESLIDMVNETNSSLPTGKVLAAISGDYPFWSSRTGYVVRDGQGYRSDKRNTSDDDFAIFKDGTYCSYSESDVNYDDLLNQHGGCWQNFAFGPSLVKNGAIAVDQNQEIDNKSRSDNKRTAIGFDGNSHIYFLVSSITGSRTGKSSSSFSLYELADTFVSLGCDHAYNLDGGDSSSIYFDGTVYQSKRILGDMIYVVQR